MKYSDIQNLAEQLLKAGQAIEKLVKSVSLYKGDVLRPKFGQPKVDKPVEQKAAPTLKNTPDSLKAEREEHNKAILRSLRVGDDGRKAHPRELRPGEETRVADIQPSKLSAKDKMLNNNISQSADKLSDLEFHGSKEHHNNIDEFHENLVNSLYGDYRDLGEYDEETESYENEGDTDRDALYQAESDAPGLLWGKIKHSGRMGPSEKHGTHRALLHQVLEDRHPNIDLAELVQDESATPHLPYLIHQISKNPHDHLPLLNQLKNDDRLDDQSKKRVDEAIRSAEY